jgi:hypothetical protein
MPLRRLSVAAAVVALLASIGVAHSGDSAAAPASAQSVHEGFERGLAGWRGRHAHIRVVHGGLSGRAVRVTAKRGARTFGLRGRPYRSRTGPAGSRYVASVWVRAGRRGVLCLKVRELAGKRAVGARARCISRARAWRRIAVGYRTARPDSLLGISVSMRRRRAGDRFRMDSVQIFAASCKPRKGNCPPASDSPPPPPPPPPPPSPTPTPPPPPPASPPAGPEFGAQFHCAWSFYDDAARNAVLDRLAAAGVRWVRIDVGWDGIEDTAKGARNAWYLGMIDRCVNGATSRGIKVLVMLWQTPRWANGGAGNHVPPTNPQDYGDFARWAAGYFRGRVAAWEVWNEPDPHQPFWLGTTAQYVSLLRAAYPAFKAGDGAANVVLAGPSSNDDVWIRELYSLGAKGSFDVLATHPYQGQADAPPERADDGNRWWFTHLPAVRRVMLDYGDGAKPVWFTEFGWSTHANTASTPVWERGVTPEQQADYAVRAYNYTRENYPYVPVMFWYKERANPTGTDPHQEGYGLLDGKLAPRPVLNALDGLLTP